MTCSIDTCVGVTYARGFCRLHYMRWYKGSDIYAPIKTENTGWLLHSYRWISTTDRGKIKEHRYVVERHLGRRLRRREYVHHINGVKTDNRIENLAVITPAQHNTLHKKGCKAQRDVQGRFCEGVKKC